MPAPIGPRKLPAAKSVAGAGKRSGTPATGTAKESPTRIRACVARFVGLGELDRAYLVVVCKSVKNRQDGLALILREDPEDLSAFCPLHDSIQDGCRALLSREVVIDSSELCSFVAMHRRRSIRITARSAPAHAEAPGLARQQ